MILLVTFTEADPEKSERLGEERIKQLETPLEVQDKLTESPLFMV